MSWKVKSSKEVYKNKWMCITEDIVETNYGDTLLYGVVHKSSAVLIIPWDGKEFTLIGQYRYPVDRYTWEFPCGHSEDKDLLEMAKLELEEEAGLVAGKLEQIGDCYLAPGHHTTVIHIFLAIDLSKGKTNREQSEKGMKIRKATPKELENMIKKGLIKDSFTLSALTLLRLYRGKELV